MGSCDTKEIIVNYYLFQKKIKKNLRNQNKQDNNSSKVGYFIHPEWIVEWKNIIGFQEIKNYLDKFILKDKFINESIFYVNCVKDYIKENNIYVDMDTKFLIKNHNFIITNENLISEKFLENLVDEKTYDNLKINKKTTIEEVKYIFKKQMIILFFKKYLTIKVLIHSLSPFKKINNLINLRFVFKYEQYYEKYKEMFKKYNSQEIIKFFLCINIFAIPSYKCKNQSGQTVYLCFNEEGNQIQYNSEMDRFTKIMDDKNDISREILHPKNINFNLLKNISIRGLDNVGATCYMNATLQCLANIKPITEYLLNYENYLFLYQNVNLCLLTLKYAQVLIGLFCNESRKGSYCPEDFKKIISEYNPLFQGVKANDSKDLIIFLLEILNSELIKIHNIKHKIKDDKNSNISSKKINISKESEVYNYFVNKFKKSHSTVIGENLCGCQKMILLAVIVKKGQLILIYLIF